MRNGSPTKGLDAQGGLQPLCRLRVTFSARSGDVFVYDGVAIPGLRNETLRQAQGRLWGTLDSSRRVVSPAETSRRFVTGNSSWRRSKSGRGLIRSDGEGCWIVKGEIDGHGAVVGHWLGREIVQVGESSREVGREKVRSFHISRIIEFRLDEDPVEFEFCNAHLSPNQLRHESGGEPFC